jgi:hypothetical protein
VVSKFFKNHNNVDINVTIVILPVSIGQILRNTTDQFCLPALATPVCIPNSGVIVFMKQILVIYLSTCLLACGQHKQPAEPTGDSNTVVTMVDSTRSPFLDSLHSAHSLLDAEMRDSLFAIKPLAVFKSDAAGDCIDKMIAAYIDTNGVTKTEIDFTDTTIYKRDKEENILSQREIAKSKRFIVEVFGPDVQNRATRKLIINGREMRPGIELDTSLAGMSWADYIQLNHGPSYLVKFGTKEFLLLDGGIERCNGSGCGVRYYILYDLRLKRAILVEQFRQDFMPGFDTKTNSPVFMYMDEEAGFSDQFKCFIYSGSVFRFDHKGKAKKVVNKKGQPLHFFGYYADEGDSIILTKGNSNSFFK